MSMFQGIKNPLLNVEREELKPNLTVMQALSERAIQAQTLQSSEIRRILSLPVMASLTEDEQESYSKDNVLCSAYEDGFRLLPDQAEGLISYELFGGGFFLIGVGGGKTGISLMIPEKAFRDFGIRKMILIVPAALAPQLINNDIPFWRARTPISYKIHILSGRSKKDRLMVAKRGRSGLYIMSDSLLSTDDTNEVLESIAPELIVVDEAHKLANPRAARTVRFFRALREYTPQLVVMSGTMTDKSIYDYKDLANFALKDNSFLPTLPGLFDEFANLLDAETTKDDRCTDTWRPGPLQPLIEWAQEHTGESMPKGVAGFRRAYAERMTTSPGVVSSGGSFNVGASLVFMNHRISKGELAHAEGWEKVCEYGGKIEDEMVTPNGDELEHSMLAWKWLYQIYGAGYYTERVWPTPAGMAQNHGITKSEAEKIIPKAKDYYEATQRYHKFLREWFKSNEIVDLETPMQVARNMSLHGDRDVGYQLFDTWQDHVEADFSEREKMNSRSNVDVYLRDMNAVRLCDVKIKQAVTWAKKECIARGKGGIIWVYHIEVGLWMKQYLMEEGLPVLYCPAGDNVAILDKKYDKHILVASMRAHGEGKNLQHFDRQWFLQTPRSAKLMQQVLGRMHRTGQKSDEVIANTAHCSVWDDMIFAACLNDALYIHQTTKDPQRLIVADYSPVPKIFPSSVLREKISNVKTLTPEIQKLYDERFGTGTKKKEPRAKKEKT